MRFSVSKQVYDEVFHEIQALQDESLHEAVTKKKMRAKSSLSYRHISRAFQKLHEDRKIVMTARGQYWLPEYREKNIEYLRRKLEFVEGFWGTVDDLRVKKIAELEQRLLDQELYYEDRIERERILKELQKKSR